MELPAGEHRLIEVEGRRLGIFNVNGKYYAVRNVCPHMGGPLCLGTVGGAMLPSRPGEYVFGLDGRVLRCPWHGWAFDLETGLALFEIAKARVRTYAVRVKDGYIEVEVP